MNAQSRIEMPEGLALLRQPFPPHQISKLPKPYKKDSAKGNCSECGGYHALPAVHLDYVGHAALTDRLLDADPDWHWEPLALDASGLPALDRNGGLWIKLTVCGVTRLGYGSADGKTGGNAVKELIGDALRNAAMRFGAALDLWHKGDLHADEDHDPQTGEVLDVEERSSAEPAKRQKLDGPCTSATQLKTALKAFVRSLEGCGQVEDLDDLLADEETAAILAQCERDLPSWWSTGEGLPGEFVPLSYRIDQRRRDLEQIAELSRHNNVRTVLDAG